MEEIAAHVEGIVHEPTQSHEDGFDLTVAEIHAVEAPGRIDFGGGELEPAETEPAPVAKRHADDEYAWWSLDAGHYLVAYNESLDGDERFVLQPRLELLERGAFHPTLVVDALPRLPLAVGGAGLRIKENARVSTLIPR